MPKEKIIAITEILEDNGFIYSTTTKTTFYPLNVDVPDEVTTKIYQFISKSESEIGVSDSEIAMSLECKPGHCIRDKKPM